MPMVHPNPDGAFSKDKIREAVLSWDEGCMEQKVRFLTDAFGIEMEPVRIEVTVTVEVDPYDDDGTEMDHYEVVNRLQNVLDYHVGASDFETPNSPSFSVG